MQLEKWLDEYPWKRRRNQLKKKVKKIRNKYFRYVHQVENDFEYHFVIEKYRGMNVSVNLLHRENGPALVIKGRAYWYLAGIRMHTYNSIQYYTGKSDAEMALLKLKYGEIRSMNDLDHNLYIFQMSANIDNSMYDWYHRRYIIE